MDREPGHILNTERNRPAALRENRRDVITREEGLEPRRRRFARVEHPILERTP